MGGMTLVEVLIVLALLSVFSIFVVSLVIISQNAWVVQNTAVPVRAEAKQTMEAMAKELRAGDPSAGVTIGGPNNSQITFSIPNQVSQNGVLNWRQIQFSYDPANQQVMRTETANGIATTTTLGRNVQSLQFALANNVVTTTIGTARTTSAGLTIQTALTSQLRLRN